MNYNFGSIVGWYGLLAVLLGYALVSFDIFLYSNFICLFLNITGSIGLGILTFKKKAWSLSLFYFIWAMIGLMTFIKISF